MSGTAPCLSKPIIAYLKAFVGVEPFFKTKDPSVDASHATLQPQWTHF
jgi:hypothetical protein